MGIEQAILDEMDFRPLIFKITTVPISLHLVLTDQIRYMSEYGFQVLMVSADGPERQTVIQTEGRPHIIIPFTRAITPWQDLKCLWQLILLIKKIQPDIIHTHTPKAGLLGMLAARITGVPVRIHTIAGLPFMTTSGVKRKLLMAMEKLTYWGAQHVWPNSQSMLDFVKAQKLCPESKLGMISKGSTNGIDLDQFSPAVIQKDKLETIKTSFNYDASLTYILAVGRVVKDKGIPELVEAFLELSSKNAALRLLLIGPLEEERNEELLPTSTLFNIKNNSAIQHIHWTDEVAYYLHLADVLVHASHREGFPNVLLQAGAMNCPIVCSIIPGNIDIVENEQTGLTYPVGNVIALIKCLQHTIEHLKEAQKMAKKLRVYIEENFNRKNIHQTILAKYKSLLASRKFK